MTYVNEEALVKEYVRLNAAGKEVGVGKTTWRMSDGDTFVMESSKVQGGAPGCTVYSRGKEG